MGHELCSEAHARTFSVTPGHLSSDGRRAPGVVIRSLRARNVLGEGLGAGSTVESVHGP